MATRFTADDLRDSAGRPARFPMKPQSYADDGSPALFTAAVLCSEKHGQHWCWSVALLVVSERRLYVPVAVTRRGG